MFINQGSEEYINFDFNTLLHQLVKVTKLDEGAAFNNKEQHVMFLIETRNCGKGTGISFFFQLLFCRFFKMNFVPFYLFLHKRCSLIICPWIY